MSEAGNTETLVSGDFHFSFAGDVLFDILVAIEVLRKYGKENIILLNHDIHESVEDADIKRFKVEVAKLMIQVKDKYESYAEITIFSESNMMPKIKKESIL